MRLSGGWGTTIFWIVTLHYWIAVIIEHMIPVDSRIGIAITVAMWISMGWYTYFVTFASWAGMEWNSVFEVSSKSRVKPHRYRTSAAYLHSLPNITMTRCSLSGSPEVETHMAVRAWSTSYWSLRKVEKEATATAQAMLKLFPD